MADAPHTSLCLCTECREAMEDGATVSHDCSACNEIARKLRDRKKATR